MSLYYRSRGLLIDPPPGDGHEGYNRAESFDTNMVIILAALLAALICALGINSMVRCIMRCNGGVGPGTGDETTTTSRFGRKGLKKGLIRKIPVAVFSAGEGEVAFTECPICLGEFLDGEKIRVLPKCHHCFHVKCVDVWLASHTSCPTCRQSVEEPEGRQQVGNGYDAPAHDQDLV